VVGEKDRYLRRVREALGVQIVMRGHVLRVEGAKEVVREATSVLAEMRANLREKGFLKDSDVDSLLDMVRAENEPDALRIPVFIPGRTVRPLTAGQAHYLRAIQEFDIVFATGPAGTGKTYLAVAMAVSALKQQRVRKIVLARPAREAGESLGFLPGDLQTKINPYLRPLYDAMEDMMDVKLMQRYMVEDVVEIVPLAFMRGRTLDNAFIILDEAQNCTTAQMKMFLTRLGKQSKTVLTGDLSQVDLPAHLKSGMTEATEILKSIGGIAFVKLSQSDIVRHRLVQEIVDAYNVKTGSGRFSEHGRPGIGLDDADAG
jgi:phosphate starvation-inducible protein PhoH and related proteins